MRKRRLWWRLFISYLWVPIVLLVALGLYGSNVVEQLYTQHVRADLEDRAWLAAEPIDDLLTRNQQGKVDALCKTLGHASRTRITAVLPSGKVIGDSDADPADMDDHSNREEIKEALAVGSGYIIRQSATLHETRIYVAVRLMHGDGPVAVVRNILPAYRVEYRVERGSQPRSDGGSRRGVMLRRHQPGHFAPHEPALGGDQGRSGPLRRG